ncbi:MAG: NAD-binding protein [Myxococcales bacterium]|nr:NAD-binding protein [Myxococcales bacterium]
MLLILITASVLLTAVEVMLPGMELQAVEAASDGLTALFAVELVLRFWIARKKTRFFERYWVDILAVLPLIRPLRLFRVLRMLRLFRAGVLFRRRISTFNGGFRTQGGEFLGLMIATILILVFCAIVLRAVEGPGNGEFDTLSEVLWFSAFSLVGGEPIGGTPVSDAGRWTTLLLMVGGMTLFGVFVGTVSAGMVTRLRGRLEVHELDIDELVDHVVVCGWNHSARAVLTEMFGPGSPVGRAVVVVTEKPIPDDDIPMDKVRVEHLYRHIGDYTRETVLKAIGIVNAESVILMADDLVARSNQDCDARTVLAALTIERMVPDIYTVAELHSRQSEELLRNSGVEDVVVADFYAGMILGSVQRNRGLVRVLNDILTQAHGSAFHTVSLPKSWAGRRAAELHQELYREHRALLVSVEQEGNVFVNPDPEVELTAGQRIVVICQRIPF